MEHAYFECPKDCDKPYCDYCVGGLASCTVCMGGEASLASECPGEVLSQRLQQRIQDHDIDYQSGAWVELGTRQICTECEGVSVMGLRHGEGKCQAHLKNQAIPPELAFRVELTGRPGSWKGVVTAAWGASQIYTEDIEECSQTKNLTELPTEIYAAVQRCVERHVYFKKRRGERG